MPISFKNNASKNIAIINSSSTINNASKESLDAALIYGSYEQNIALFFQGEGVRQLIKNQKTEIVKVKNFLKTMAALEFYDIENIYVCKKSLIERGLIEDFHIENIQLLDVSEFSNKLHLHHVILRF